MKEILVTRPSMPAYEEYCAEIKDIWDSRWLTNFGPKHHEFAEKLQIYLGTDNISLFVNGHQSLETVLAAYAFPKGSEVITTPFTFVSTTHSITRSGLVPVFCDIREDDYTIDPSKIEELISDKTVAIMPVHVYGHVCDVEKIKEIADRHDLKVIYDAAHAFGVRYKGKEVSTYGDASIFSFHATKVFNSIEGGAAVIRDSTIRSRIKPISDFGIVDVDEVDFVGMNAKMNEFQAAMGICNLRHADDNIRKRKIICERYDQLLSGIDGIVISGTNADTLANYAYYPILITSATVDRNKVASKLAEKGIHVRKYFYPSVNKMKPYLGNRGHTPVSEDVASKVLTLPLYPDLPLEDVDMIAKTIIEILKRGEKG